MKITAFIIAILFIVVGYKGISVALKEYLQVWITTSGKVIEYSFEPNSPGFDQSFRRLNILYEYTVDGTVFQSRSVRADPSQIAVPPDVLALVGFDQQTGTIPVQYLQSEPSVSRIYHLETASTYVAGLVALLVLMAGLAIIYWVFIAPNFVHNLNQGGL